MKNFIKSICAFSVPIILVAFVIEISVRSLPNSYQLKSDYLEASSKEIETLILGSSHTLYGVNPKYLDSKAFNTSHVSQSPDVDLAILKDANHNFESLQTLVIRLSYDTLFEQLKNSEEDWRLKDYQIYTTMPFDYDLRHYSEMLSIGLKGCLNVLRNHYVNHEITLKCDSLGWGNDLATQIKPNIEEVGAAVAKRHKAKSWDLLEENLKVFENIIKWCQMRNVQVLLITPPAYKSYRDHLDISQLKQMKAIGEILDRKNNNCTYYNLMAHEDFAIDHFYDPDHLNALGAKKFSLLINNLIEY